MFKMLTQDEQFLELGPQVKLAMSWSNDLGAISVNQNPKERTGGVNWGHSSFSHQAGFLLAVPNSLQKQTQTRLLLIKRWRLTTQPTSCIATPSLACSFMRDLLPYQP